jgi:micrococcal nuclease
MLIRAGIVLILVATVAVMAWWPRGVAIVDGDTLDIGPWRYRLFGIDTPEPGASCQRAGETWNVAAASSAALRDLIAGGGVGCETVYREPFSRWPPRWVANCSAAGVPDIGRALALAGWACDYRKYSMGHFAAVEAEAKAARRGLWACDTTPPWRC